MARKDQDDWHGCPIRFGLGIFGDKWTLLLVRDLMFKGKRHYGEFTDPEENISTNILADRLARLVENGIVDKQRDAGNRARYVYSLTQKGLDLAPMMLAMIDWSLKYDERTGVPAEFAQRLKSDPAGLLDDVRRGATVP